MITLIYCPEMNIFRLRNTTSKQERAMVESEIPVTSNRWLYDAIVEAKNNPNTEIIINMGGK